jgi:activating signal cointegrator complex subunit 1
MATFEKALLEHSPRVHGLDDKILVSPRRMHMTLGVMSLAESPRRNVNDHESNTKTVQAAIELLHQLRPQILEKLGGETLQVGLNSMDIMRPERGDLTKAHVMWAGPTYDNERAKRLKRVCGTSTAFITTFSQS